MSEPLPDGRHKPGAVADGHARSRDMGRYLLALVGYIVLGFITKGFLSFTYGLLYFVLVLDVLPRTLRFLRARTQPTEPTAEVIDS